MIWEEPPPATRRAKGQPGKWDRFVEELKAHPDEWARSERLYHFTNTARLKHQFPDIQWRFVRTQGRYELRRGYIFGRYNTNGEGVNNDE